MVSYLTIYILVTSDDEKELKEKCKSIEKAVQLQKLKIRPLTNFLLIDAFKAVAPFFTIQNDLSEFFKRNILTSTFTGGFLFDTDTFIDDGGYYWGINQNGGIVIFNMWLKDDDRNNSNMVIEGSSGSGKSICLKHLIYNCIPTSKILVIDSENEYSFLCDKLKGKTINCGGSQNGQILNPLQVRNSDDEEGDNNILSLHFQFLHTFFKILFPSLNEIEFSMLDLLLEKLYIKFNITGDTDISRLKNTDFPTLEDLYFLIVENNKNKNEAILDKLLSLLRPIAIGN